VFFRRKLLWTNSDFDVGLMSAPGSSAEVQQPQTTKPIKPFCCYCCRRHIDPGFRLASGFVFGAKSDLEPRFVCTACGKRGADVRPDFPPARMGTG